MIGGVDMLPKRPTHVGQNLEYESIHSQLSVAIFMASRTHLGTQECTILVFYPQIRHIPAFLGMKTSPPIFWVFGGGSVPMGYMAPARYI